MESRQHDLEREILNGILKRLASPTWLESLRSSGTTKIGKVNVSVCDIESNIVDTDQLMATYQQLSAKKDSDTIEDKQVAIIGTDNQPANATISSRLTVDRLQKDFGLDVSKLTYREMLLLNDVCFDINNSIFRDQVSQGNTSPLLNGEILAATRSVLEGIDFSEIRLSEPMQFEANSDVLVMLLRKAQPSADNSSISRQVEELKVSAEHEAQDVVARDKKAAAAESENKKAIADSEREKELQKEQAPEKLKKLIDELLQEESNIQSTGNRKEKLSNKQFMQEVRAVSSDQTKPDWAKLSIIEEAKREYENNKPDPKAKSSKTGFFGTMFGRRRNSTPASGNKNEKPTPGQSKSDPGPPSPTKK